RVDPTIESNLLNVRGLAHKVNWEMEYWYADSNADLDEIPYYDPLDDNAQEQFRRRFIGDTFGGTLPSRFDPRTYAFRQGIQSYVTSASPVIADDLQQFRLGVNQRFQTKRGLRGRDRIVDLLQFDVATTIFPDADRDNFGETIGPTTYDLRYHLGDRFSILSDGYIDFFDDGLRSISAGVRTSRPGVSDFYVGLLSLEGPINSTVLRTAMDYRLNEKWIVSGGTTYDFGSVGSVGQSLGITRIGESLLLRINVNIDPGRDNVGVGFAIEPRFFARTLGAIGGGMIPAPGLEGLE
ncbi:MAG: organic solvent tolerance protein OstA, partial [Planctomycetota bacterium]